MEDEDHYDDKFLLVDKIKVSLFLPLFVLITTANGWYIAIIEK